MKVTWAQLNLPQRLTMDVKDLWSGRRTEGASGSFGALVASHGVVMVRMMPRTLQPAW
jgi:alpha-galactosidase